VADEKPAHALDVHCFDKLAGRLVDERGGVTFAYDPDWLTAAMPPLSQSLPLDGSYDSAEVAAFFGGLLPEGVPRDLLARRLGVSPGNDFGLLAAVGGDTAGAISLQPSGRSPSPSGNDVEWLDKDALATLIDELPSRPMHADEDGEYRLSLAGAQDKLPVVVGEDGRIGLTKGQAPSTHILKTPIERLDDTVANEAFSLALGRALGIDAVTATPHRVEGREFLLVERYDRRRQDGTIRRLHQLLRPAAQSNDRPRERDPQAARRHRAELPGRQPRRAWQELLLALPPRCDRRCPRADVRHPEHRRLSQVP
jgi:serine/threonine-protein kinase HipA